MQDGPWGFEDRGRVLQWGFESRRSEGRESGVVKVEPAVGLGVWSSDDEDDGRGNVWQACDRGAEGWERMMDNATNRRMKGWLRGELAPVKETGTEVKVVPHSKRVKVERAEKVAEVGWGFGGVAKGEKKVRIKEEEQAVQKKGRGALWKGLVEGESEVLTGVATMQGIVGERWEGEMQLQKLQWKRTREKVALPERGEGLLELGRQMADDYAVMSKSEATWRSYKSWWRVCLAFAERFEVDMEAASWKVQVEVIRIGAALMSMLYSWGTIDIFVTACSNEFRLREWRSPWEAQTLKATLNGMKRVLGVKAEKKPPAEPHHVREMLLLEGPPESMSELQWEQAQVLVLFGFVLFNRRQDFGRLQPCDIREIDKQADGRRVWEVLIRYAKNDMQGLTRAPRIVEGEDSRFCVLQRLESYMRKLGIVKDARCNKQWGKPYACDFCQPLFPAIWKRHGKKQHAMPDSRVASTVKGVFAALAEAKPDVLSEEEAKKFSTRSLRSGGVSSAAAECVRDGVVQGHGGWLARESLRHYDQMKENERTGVVDALGKAIAKAYGTERGVVGGESMEQNERERVRGVEPRAEDWQSDEAEVSDEDEGEREDLQWAVERIMGAKRVNKHQMFLVKYEGFEEPEWEFELDLLADGCKPSVDVYLEVHTKDGKVRKGRGRSTGQASA